MDIVVFGTGHIAEVADYYFSQHSPYRVVAFVLDPAFIREATFLGRPVLTPEQSFEAFPPASCGAFVSIGYSKRNTIRRAKLDLMRSLGYRAVSYISAKATVYPDLGDRENLFILEGSIVQPFATIGHNVTLWGAIVSHHSKIGDDCFLAPRSVVSGGVVIGDGVFIGINAAIRDHVTIGRQAIIGAGSTVMTNVSELKVVTATEAF